MELKFTLFNDDAMIPGGAYVYMGHLKEPSPGLPAYRIKCKKNKYWLYDGRPKHHGRSELLYGKLSFFSFLGKIGTIDGYNSTFEVSRSGVFSTKLKFVDSFTGRQYKWKVGAICPSGWELYDQDDKMVAHFDRHIFKMSRHGQLTVYQDKVPEHLLGLILLTHKLLHNIVSYKNDTRNRNGKTYGYSYEYGYSGYDYY
ncbi:hypothetical protein BC941DRAFT_436292 [Chlamydoabsidia padenii]|nr:hypothetical protein BC941DRAFT_436292 [Chlamydoabsidia padenii]